MSVAIQSAEDKARFNAILDAEHYLGARQPSGNTVYQVIKDEAGAWVAIVLWCGACYRLDPRDTHIGWDMRKREEPPTARKALRGIGSLSGALVTGDAGNCLKALSLLMRPFDAKIPA